ncbi:UDP-glycosyltransferase 71K1 [Coffea arabica]|uniref:Glycosyltransferase n=1 Tax=Coffea arabica TaxID=13443 RepID=A0A6P6U645_COFAR|nr:anthocyanidin 3-O-glucosyltransferase 2-like [Coffea arabica]
MKNELVFVAAPGRGHIVSEIEFAKRLSEVDRGISVTVLLMKSSSLDLDSFIQELAASVSSSNIQFISLPKVDPPPSELKSSNESYFAAYIEKHKCLVKDAIINHVLPKSGTHLAGLVIDLFCSSMIDVANELGIPSYVFCTSSAAFLGLVLYLPIRHSLSGTEFSISDPDSSIPAFANLVPSGVLPSFLFNKHGGYSSFLSHGTQFQKAKGFIINTFAELESHAINFLTADKESPQVYTVGPVINLDITKKLSESDRKIMKWLDDQPSSSVVFLCFGSIGGFEPPQLAEIAIALKQSGHRFLWSVQPSPPKDFTAKPKVYANFSDVLPKGFLERTKDRGLVCGWAPQVEILRHHAVGGFVSHCGWNSILESLWNGVPIATWPVYGEQQSNAFQLVKDLELAVELTLDYRFENSDEIVVADKIEKAINWLMDSENPVRQRVKDLGEKGRKALMDGGSSLISFGRFIADISVNRL